MAEGPEDWPPTSTAPTLPPAFHPGPGYAWTAVEDHDRFVRLVTRQRKCRWTVGPGHKQCTRTAAIEIHRGDSGWWGYCLTDGHGYGRWLDHGRIMIWVQRPEAPDG